MKFLISLFIALLTCGVSAQAQDRGVDPQNDRIRDAGNDRGPANNGANQDTGTGRGIEFGRRARAIAPVPNPYRLTARRDLLMQAIEELMRDRSLILDTDASRPADGIIISQPFTFIRGAVVTQNELNRYADVPSTSSRGWTRARYTLTVEVQAIDGTSNNVSVNARVEGRTEGATGAEWVTLRSSGQAEQDFISALVERVTGAPPPGRSP